MSTFDGITKAIDKLIQVCATGIGIVYEPRHLIKMAEAYKRADKILDSVDAQLSFDDGKISICSAQPLKLSQLTQSTDSIQEDSQSRINYQEKQYQENIEKTIGFAVEELQNDENISEDSVDISWSDAFFNDAAHIFDEDLQILWGKILAGEIANPGKYSLKTLSILRTLSKKDAKLFEKYSQTVFKKNEIFFVWSDCNLITQNESNLIEKESLVSLGLLTSEGLNWTLFENSRLPEAFEYGEHIVLLNSKQETKKFTLGFYNLSQAGIELMSILPERNIQYLQNISKYCKPKNVILEYSKINYINNGSINYSLPTKSFP